MGHSQGFGWRGTKIQVLHGHFVHLTVDKIWTHSTFSHPFWQVGYALDFPWRASLPRIETRMYLEQYGGSADVWIGKVLYR
jgi:hypothetical protein